MKILMVSSGYYPDSCGGVEVITQSLAEGLKKKGIEVSIVCSGEENRNYEHNGIKVYIVKPREITIFTKKRIVYILNRILQMYNPLNKKYFKNILKIENPDIVHIHMVRKLSLSILAVCSKEKIPMISTLHECFSLWNFNPFDDFNNILISKPPFICRQIRKIHRNLTAKVSFITSPSKTTIEKYKSEGYYKNVKDKEILNSLPFKIENAIYERDIKIRKIKNTKLRKFLIISRLEPFKGIEVALKAFHNIKNENIELHIAGKGSLEKLINEYQKIDKRIFFHGYVIGEEKETLFRNTDVLLFPTVSFETFGLVCLEAYYYSMPIIATNVEATRRLINDGLTGTLLKDESIEELQKIILEYCCLDNLLKKVKKCYLKIDQFNYQTFIEEHISLYNKLFEINN